METRSPSCPRCQGSMEPGYVLDEGYGARTVGQWVAGKPEKSIWTGLKLSGRQKLEITTYRCRRCGCLESYA